MTEEKDEQSKRPKEYGVRTQLERRKFPETDEPLPQIPQPSPVTPPKPTPPTAQKKEESSE